MQPKVNIFIPTLKKYLTMLELLVDGKDKSVEFQKGQVLILAIVVLSLVVISTVLLLNGSISFLQNTNYSVSKLQAVSLAEAGIDKAVASLNATGGSYSGEGTGVSGIALGSGEYSVTITNIDANSKKITSTGYVPNKIKPVDTRVVNLIVSKGVGASFNFGLQVGDGGLVMSNNVTINGSVYANGNISMSDNAIVKGDAYVAGGAQPNSDQQSDCIVPNCLDYIFGKNVSGENRQDVAQSFQPSANNVLNKVSLKLKKVGTPNGDPTVRLMADIIGMPNKNNVLATGTLNSSLVSNSYGFVDVTFNTTPAVLANTPYWIMIHSNTLDNNNYWVWSEDPLKGYTRGLGSWSANWQALTPTWTTLNAGLGFKTYMGGVVTSIIGTNNATIGNDAHAHLLQGLTINRDAYYQTLQSSIVKGTTHPGSADPVPYPMPISDSNIQDWKTQALASGVFIGDVTSCKNLPSGKYIGSINITSNCIMTVGSPIWVTGNITTSNNLITIKLDPTLGATSGMLIADGTITIGDAVRVQGSGTPGSYLMLLSTYNSRDDPLHKNAIVITDNLFAGILYSNLGSINVTNNASMYQLTGWKVYLSDGININYQTGLSGVVFASGPSGSFSVVKGSYQLK